jgi:hypothetical protein
MVTGKFIHLPAATLATMLTEWNACLSAIATSHQAYSIAGRQITRANLDEVSNIVAEICYAQKLQAGTLQRVTYSDMSNG